MAEFKLESLVLPVVCVAKSVVAGLERAGSNQASGATPTVPLSFTRHLPPGYPRIDMDPVMRHAPADGNAGEAPGAQRAGRPGSSAGVLGSRSLAITAGSAILSGWSSATRGTATAKTKRPGRHWPVTPTLADRLLSGRSQSFTCFTASLPARALSWPRLERGEKRVTVVRASMGPVQGMPSASM
jgi:hypothetical protein